MNKNRGVNDHMDSDDESSNALLLIDHKTTIFEEDSEDGSNNIPLIDYDSVGDELVITVHNIKHHLFSYSKLSIGSVTLQTFD